MRRLLTGILSAAVIGGTLAVATPPAMAAQPTVGECYNYPQSQAGQLNNPATPVNCNTNHTAETFHVGTLPDSLGDPNKATDNARLSLTFAACSDAKVNEFLGLTGRTMPSRWASFSFFPSTEQYKAGERWFRCDVVLREGTGFKTYKGTAKAYVAGKNAAIWDYCTPGVGPTKEPNFRVMSAQTCNTSQPGKNWIIIKTPSLGGANSKFPATIAGQASKKCVAASKEYPGISKSPLYFFLYPGTLEWSAGKRSATCLVPLSQYVDSTLPSKAGTPAVGNCYSYNKSVIDDFAFLGAPQACTESHRAETYLVGTLPDGFGDPALASANARQSVITNTCTASALNGYLGFTDRTLPARFDSYGFFPSPGDYKAGARWIRCDVVFLNKKGFGAVSQPMKDFVASQPAVGLDYCTPSVGFARTPDEFDPSIVGCSRDPKKTWINVRTTELQLSKAKPTDTAIKKAAVKFCKSVQTEFKGKAKKPSWYYIKPSAFGWELGERTVNCFVPLKQYQESIAPDPVPTGTETPVA